MPHDLCAPSAEHSHPSINYTDIPRFEMTNRSSSPDATERTPLVAHQSNQEGDKVEHVPLAKVRFSPLRRVMFVALVSATSFAFTQTSLIYAFRVMTCDDHFQHLDGHDRKLHLVESVVKGGDRCAIPVVEARTARAIALMSTMTTFCCKLQSSFFPRYNLFSTPWDPSWTGESVDVLRLISLLAILNLFVTGYWFKKLGIKMAMFQQTFWAALRSLTQIYALSIGGQFGINLITITQAINVLGSGGGYELASMAYIAQLCGQEERTGMFGILMGIRMFGAAIGYICESTRSRKIHVWTRT